MSVGDSLGTELLAAFRSRRPDPRRFDEAVRERIEAGSDMGASAARVSSRLRAAASFLPIPVIVGGKVLVVSAKSGTASTGMKILGYAALPAISLVMLLGAVMVTLLRIRQLPPELDGTDIGASRAALRAWWRKRWWLAALFLAATLAVPFSGSSSVLFYLVVGSIVSFTFILAHLARLGIATRRVVAAACIPGLLLLTYIAAPASYRGSELHLIDPRVSQGVLYLSLAILVHLRGSGLGRKRTPRGVRWVFMVVLVAGGIISCRSLLFRATDGQAVAFVEAFDEAEFGGASWEDWEAVATWAMQTGQDVDWTRPRALVASGFGQRAGPAILGSAMRVGLIPDEDLRRLRGVPRAYERWEVETRTGRPLRDAESVDWWVRALLRQGKLSPSQRSEMAQQVRGLWEALRPDDSDALRQAYVMVGLLDVLGRPLDPETERSRVHLWLQTCYAGSSGDWRSLGGFDRQGQPETEWPNYSEEGTWYAVQLMRRFGVPKEVDINAVRCFLRPDKWSIGEPSLVALAARRTVDSIPGVGPLTWRDYLQYERSLLALTLLALLCIIATWRAPKGPERTDADEDNSDPPAFEFLYEA